MDFGIFCGEIKWSENQSELIFGDDLVFIEIKDFKDDCVCEFVVFIIKDN